MKLNYKKELDYCMNRMIETGEDATFALLRSNLYDIPEDDFRFFEDILKYWSEYKTNRENVLASPTTRPTILFLKEV